MRNKREALLQNLLCFCEIPDLTTGTPSDTECWCHAQFFLMVLTADPPDIILEMLPLNPHPVQRCSGSLLWLCIPFKNGGLGVTFKPFTLALANLASLHLLHLQKGYLYPNFSVKRLWSLEPFPRNSSVLLDFTVLTTWKRSWGFTYLSREQQLPVALSPK